MRPVAVWVIVTVTPGSTDPVESWTVPCTWETEIACAAARPHAAIVQMTPTTDTRVMLTIQLQEGGELCAEVGGAYCRVVGLSSVRLDISAGATIASASRVCRSRIKAR